MHLHNQLVATSLRWTRPQKMQRSTLGLVHFYQSVISFGITIPVPMTGVALLTFGLARLMPQVRGHGSGVQIIAPLLRHIKTGVPGRYGLRRVQG